MGHLGAAAANSGTGTSNAPRVTMPASISAGDIAVIWISSNTGSETYSGGSNFGSFVINGTTQYNSTVLATSMFVKTCDGSESGTSVGPNLGASRRWAISVEVVNGMTLDQVVSDQKTTTSTTTSVPCPAATPSADNALVVGMGATLGQGNAGTSYTFTSGANYTERADTCSSQASQLESGMSITTRQLSGGSGSPETPSAMTTSQNVGRQNRWTLTFIPSGATPVSGSDTGAGTDASSLAVAHTRAETGTGTDASSLAATAAGSDTGTGVDASSLVVNIVAGDTGTGTDAVAARGITAGDTGSGGDSTSNRGLTGTDTGTGTDASSLAAAVAGSDTGTGTDASFLQLSITGSDTGTFTESASLVASITGSDTGSGGDASGARGLTAADTGTFVDASSLAAALAGTDVGAALEAVIARAIAAADTGTGGDASVLVALTDKSGSDTGTFTETASLVVTLTGSDTGSGSDASAMTATLLGADIFTGQDAATLAAALTAADTGTAVDVSIQGRFGADTGLFTEASSLVKTLVWMFMPPSSGTSNGYRRGSKPAGRLFSRTSSPQIHYCVMIFDAAGTPRVVKTRRPTNIQMAEADYVYLGPREYELSEEEYAILADSEFADDLVPLGGP